MILTTIYRVKYHWDEITEMTKFDNTAKANGYTVIDEDVEGRTYEFRKDYTVGVDDEPVHKV